MVEDLSESSATEWTPKVDLLARGYDDWVPVAFVVSSARLTGERGYSVGLRDRTLALIAEVIDEGLMVAGDIDLTERTFVPWDCAPSQAVERIVSDWLTEFGTREPNPGDMAWLDITDAGIEIARAVLAREGYGSSGC